MVNAGYGLLFGLGVYALGIPHSLLWGVVGCLLRFVPYIGTPIAAQLPMAMGMAVFPGWSQVALTFVLFLFLEITIANFVESWLYGAHTGVSSLAILVAAIFLGMLWGPVGLILSTPLTVCLILMGTYICHSPMSIEHMTDKPEVTNAHGIAGQKSASGKFRHRQSLRFLPNDGQSGSIATRLVPRSAGVESGRDF